MLQIFKQGLEANNVTGKLLGLELNTFGLASQLYHIQDIQNA